MKTERNKDVVTIYDDSFEVNVSCAIPESLSKAIANENVGYCYFYNPYFKAASQYCGVKTVGGEFWGMLCPLCLFAVENAELYKDLKWFQHSMMYDGFEKYLHDSIVYNKDNAMLKDGVDFRLSYDISYYIFVFDKQVECLISNYLASFFDNGFMYVDSPFVHKEYYVSQYKEDNIEYKKILQLKKIPSCFDGFHFIQKLYREILPQKTNPAFRYLNIYQVVEHLMELKKNEILFDKLKKSPDIFKNDLREEMQDILKEELLINKLYEGINNHNGFYSDFCDMAEQLLDSINKKKPKSPEDFVGHFYGVRNAIVHNLKETSSYVSELVKLCELFEQAIYELIISVNVSQCNSLRLFVMDKDLPYKENKRAMSIIYHERKF